MFNTSISDSESGQPVGLGKFSGSAYINVMLSSGSVVTHAALVKEVPQKALEAYHHLKTANASKVNGSNNNTSAPAAKAHVVGWPPIRSFRKNTLATSLKNNEKVNGKPAPGALFVKVSKDSAPYLGKVDVRLQNDIISLT
ncbi:hypothetical protein AgCh_022795 [Apium graveolens]